MRCAIANIEKRANQFIGITKKTLRSIVCIMSVLRHMKMWFNVAAFCAVYFRARHSTHTARQWLNALYLFGQCVFYEPNINLPVSLSFSVSLSLALSSYTIYSMHIEIFIMNFVRVCDVCIRDIFALSQIKSREKSNRVCRMTIWLFMLSLVNKLSSD